MYMCIILWMWNNYKDVNVHVNEETQLYFHVNVHVVHVYTCVYCTCISSCGLVIISPKLGKIDGRKKYYWQLLIESEETLVPTAVLVKSLE